MDERQWLIRNPIVMVLVPILIVVISVSAWGIRNESPRELWLVALPGAGLAILMFGSLRIRAGDALLLAYFPIWRRSIPWADIRDAHAVRYDAWRYGGWGIRFSKGTVAYSVWSTQAIRFTVVGRRLAVVVTTRRAEAWLKEMERRSIGAVRSSEVPASTRRSSD